jgi:glutamate synthase domain-containing protein 3
MSIQQTQALPTVAWDGATASIDAAGVYYRPLNEAIRRAVAAGATKVVVRNVCGQRYIGDGLRKPVQIELFGTPGNDLAMFMDGPSVCVHGNGQDGVGNTMTSGQVVIDGSAGDLLAHSLRGGQIFVRGSAGYRCAIHMKQYTEPVPAVVIGGTVGDYAGEYMAGGVLIVLGLDIGWHGGAVGSHAPIGTNGWSGMAANRAAMPPSLTGQFLGTGMHGGVIYLRGDIRDDQLGKEISRVPLEHADLERLKMHVGLFASHFGLDAAEILGVNFTKLCATSTRPYGRLYVY